MGFHEDAGYPGRDCGSRQHRNILPLSPGRTALAARQLHRMRRIKDHRGTGIPHGRQGTHIGNQVVIPERHPTLTHHNLVIADSPGLVDDVFHIPGRQKLPLLDIHRPAGTRHVLDKVGLSTQKGRRLKDIHYGSHFIQRCILMHIREDGNLHFIPDFLQDSQAFFHPRAAVAAARRTIGFIKRRFIDKRDTQFSGHLFQIRRRCQCQRLTFNDTRTGYQKKWGIQPRFKST